MYFDILGLFWNPQDEQFPKLSLDLNLEQHLKEILRVLDWCRCWLPPLYNPMLVNKGLNGNHEIEVTEKILAFNFLFDRLP